jgi:hypothetical protein
MGRGNWYPNTHRGDRHNYELVYVDYESIYGENYWMGQSYDESTIRFEDFEESVLNMLPSSIVPADDWPRNRDDHLLAENGLFELVTCDNETSLGIALIVKEDAPGFAESRLSSCAKLIFDELKKVHGQYLRVRCSAWTSCSYEEAAA